MAFIFLDDKRSLLLKYTCHAVTFSDIYLHVLEDFTSQFFADGGFIAWVHVIKHCFSSDACEVKLRSRGMHVTGGHDMSTYLPSGVQQMSSSKHRTLLPRHYSPSACSKTRLDGTLSKHEMSSNTCRSDFRAYFLHLYNYPCRVLNITTYQAVQSFLWTY